MNDLTKEARERAYEEEMNRARQTNAYGLTNLALSSLGMASAHHGNALASAMAGPKYGDKSLNPDRPLTGEPGDYLTRWDEGSRCDRLDVPRGTIPPKYVVPAGSIDIDEFRKFCEEIGE